MKKRVQVYYSGMVQGVGFRFTAERVAQGLGLGGWVRNIPDGRVELVCEGEEEALSDLLKKIKAGTLKQYIQDAKISWSSATGEFEGFAIRFF
ncbi:MAG: acylphosphatase [Candidatus Omnitrophota bacterium]